MMLKSKPDAHADAAIVGTIAAFVEPIAMTRSYCCDENPLQETQMHEW